MHCKSCLTQCLETDLCCPHCKRLLVGGPGESRRPAIRIFGLVFAAVGACAVLIYPTPPGLHANNLAIAGLGSVAGGLFGATVGWILAWFFDKEARAIPVTSQPASRAVDDD